MKDGREYCSAIVARRMEFCLQIARIDAWLGAYLFSFCQLVTLA